ncbi:MAG: MerR family transcriptional regulator [Clostridia bacterium]|nr:MerR family transcriptional regulator [Candidatus Pelethousia sp.]NCB30741.1 MerR family transcriptional regulator [Clostridia bacterium]
MQLMKCKWCGRPFQSIGVGFCPKCLQELDDQYKPVRDYLYDNPNATIDEVVEATGVSQRVILYYLRDGRLQMVNSSGLLRCEQCGAPINSGRFCEKCTNKVEQRMIKPLQNRVAQNRQQASEEVSRMHTYKGDRT